ncbi:hypothetical protein P261_00131 [Lachnospiraceae bacterium TWA4]|nr:hypothetical protein P261_00131 [Lachnospiraceae bacterium TWA4]
MLKDIKLNMLFPIKYEPNNLEKLNILGEESNKKTITKIKEEQSYNCKEWFSYCYRSKPISKTFQLTGSPLLNKDSGCFIERLELNQPVRTMIGLHKNQTCQYKLAKSNLSFNIGKINVLLFPFGTGFIQMEIIAHDYTEKMLLDLNAQLSSVQMKAKFSYNLNIAKDVKENKVLTLKEVIYKILQLQSYISFCTYKEETLGKAYTLVFFTGILEKKQTIFIF